MSPVACLRVGSTKVGLGGMESTPVHCDRQAAKLRSQLATAPGAAAKTRAENRASLDGEPASDFFSIHQANRIFASAISTVGVIYTQTRTNNMSSLALRYKSATKKNKRIASPKLHHDQQTIFLVTNRTPRSQISINQINSQKEAGFGAIFAIFPRFSRLSRLNGKYLEFSLQASDSLACDNWIGCEARSVLKWENLNWRQKRPEQLLLFLPERNEISK